MIPLFKGDIDQNLVNPEESSSMPAGKGRLLYSEGEGPECIWIEFHVVQSRAQIDWSEYLPHDGWVVCLNTSGDARIGNSDWTMDFSNGTLGVFRMPKREIKARIVREEGQLHEFVILSFPFSYLRRELESLTGELLPDVRKSVFENPEAAPDGGISLHGRPMRQSDRDFLRSILAPPVRPEASEFYYAAKLKECLSMFFFKPSGQGGDFFCVKQLRMASGRVGKVREYLRQHLDEASNLEKLGQVAGCSPSYLSRIFAESTGTTIIRYLRDLRIEKAAGLLLSGRYNVSEAAVEVGYNSLSHFSKAFKKVKGCYPSDYDG